LNLIVMNDEFSKVTYEHKYNSYHKKITSSSQITTT
jgi:hypothetical protein